MSDRVEVHRRRYHDSVRLMQVSRDAAAAPGVEAAMVAMGTDLNLELLDHLGFPPPDAGPDDLIVAVRAGDAAALDAAVAAVARALDRAPAAPAGATRPALRTVEAAGRAGATLALISVPGRYAFVEAMAAVRAGLDVMVFSNGVPIEHEVALKGAAAERGVLVMGPDCGTAIVAGVGLGFANATRPGPVGIAGASGTGIQQLCCLLDDAGIGIRHALGTGSNDLTAEVGGISTEGALAALDADPGTEVIVLVSKAPDPAVAERLGRTLEALDTPAVAAFLGSTSIAAAAAEVAARLGRTLPPAPVWPAPVRRIGAGRLRGLFSGGSLCTEAAAVAGSLLGAIGADEASPGHTCVDYGADRYTGGRAHPMIDPTIRLDRLAALAGPGDTAVVLLDVVLGFGAHPDPAGAFAPAIERIVAGDGAVVVSLIGTSADPQGRDDTARRLQEAGAAVYGSNAAAAAAAARLSRGEDP